MKTKYILSILIVLIVSLVAFKLSANKKTIDEKSKKAPEATFALPVKTAMVTQELMEISILKTGSLAPFKEAKVIATTSGTIGQLPIELGDQVRQGQIIAVTDTRSSQLELQKAQRNAYKLKGELETYTQLLAGKATTQEKVNEINQSYQDAKSQVEQSRKILTDASIKAPTSGIISAKAVEQGVFVNAGAEIATIVNLSKAKVQVYLTESEVYQVSKGQKVKITTDVYPGKTFNGTVNFMSPQADQTHSYLTEVIIDNSGEAILRSGTFVYADFSKTTSEQVLLIPREAINESVQNAAVYVISKGKAYLRPVRTGIEKAGMVQITEGLKLGDQVVISGQINLKDGTTVSISH